MLARDWPIWPLYLHIQLLTSMPRHRMTYLVNIASWLLSCLPKTLEYDKFHIQCWIEAIQISLELEWRDLWFGTNYGRFWALWFLIIFFIPWIIPTQWKLLDHQKFVSTQQVSKGTNPSLSWCQSTLLYLDWYLWSPLEDTPHWLCVKSWSSYQ